MNIKTEPLLGAAAFGIVVVVVYTLIDAVLGYTRTPPSYTALGSLASCLVSVVTGLIIGVIYAVLHQRQEPLTAGGGAKGGAAAGALAYVISGIFSAVVVLLLLPGGMATVFEAQGISPDMMEDAGGFLMAGAAIGAMGGACVFSFIGAILGALGGVIGASFGQSG